MHAHVDTRFVRETRSSTCIAYQYGWTPGGRTRVFRPRAPLDRHWGSLRNRRRAAGEGGVLDRGGYLKLGSKTKNLWRREAASISQARAFLSSKCVEQPPFSRN